MFGVPAKNLPFTLTDLLEMCDVISLAVWILSDLQLYVLWIFGVYHLQEELCSKPAGCEVHQSACHHASCTYHDVARVKVLADSDGHSVEPSRGCAPAVCQRCHL